MSVALKGVERLNVSWFTGTKESWENCCRGASYNHMANFQKRQSVKVTLFIIIKSFLAKSCLLHDSLMIS